MIYSLLNDRKTCEVCKKSFSNASALGDHMVSHTRSLSAPNAEPTTGSTVPSLGMTSNKPGANFNPRETVLVRSNHTGAVGDGPKQDLKGEEGAQQTNGKRKMVVGSEEESCLTVIEEAALCLVAMSKGQRPVNSESWTAIDRYLLSSPIEYSESETDSGDEDSEVTLTEGSDEDEDNDHADETYSVEREKACNKTFTCDVCGKAFGSYQALGGHRTSHKDKRVKVCDKNDQDVVRRFRCEVCGREFGSGQALGGHKKVHYNM